MSANPLPPTLPPWDRLDLPAVLALERVGPGRYRTRLGDANDNGRSYGGQLLGQAFMAAAQDVSAERRATSMQLQFLQGAVPELPLELEVTPLQEGKRFSARHVRGTQGAGRKVLDAHVSFGVPLQSPTHSAPSGALEAPGAAPPLRELLGTLEPGLQAMSGYAQEEKPSLEFRLADPGLQAAADGARVRFWVRARVGEASPRVHEGVFAFLSDWWINFSSLSSHAGELVEQGRSVYVSSLNHGIWFHQPVRVDRWLHFDSHSAWAGHGRGLSIVRVHDEQGHMVCTLSQEILMAYQDTPPAAAGAAGTAGLADSKGA